MARPKLPETEKKHQRTYYLTEAERRHIDAWLESSRGARAPKEVNQGAKPVLQGAKPVNQGAEPSPAPVMQGAKPETPRQVAPTPARPFNPQFKDKWLKGSKKGETPREDPAEA